MVAITTIGLDIAKSVFQVHGVVARGNAVVRRQLKRRDRRSDSILNKINKKRELFDSQPCQRDLFYTSRSRLWLRVAPPTGGALRVIDVAFHLLVAEKCTVAPPTLKDIRARWPTTR